MLRKIYSTGADNIIHSVWESCAMAALVPMGFSAVSARAFLVCLHPAIT